MGYNIFDEMIRDQARFASDTAQSEALIDAGNLIADAMRAQGLRQKDLAGKLGVSEGYVSRLLSGDENLTLRTMARVLHELGLRYVQQSVSDISLEAPEIQTKVISFATYSSAITPACVETKWTAVDLVVAN